MTLRNQVALYNSKYEEFEKSLTRSNKMFGSFKDEMQIVCIFPLFLNNLSKFSHISNFNFYVNF